MIAASNLNSAVNLDLADGVLDGRFFGSQIGVNAPVYKTPAIESSSTYGSLGLVGATSALTVGSYPAPTYSAVPAPTYPTVSAPTTISVANGTLPPAYSLPVYPTFAPTFSPTVLPTTTVAPTVVRPAYPTIMRQQYQIPVQLLPAPVPVVETYTYSAPQVVQVVQAVECCVAAPPPPPPQPVQVQYIQAPPEIRYVQSPPEVRYVQSPPEVRYIEGPKVVEPAPEDPKLKLQLKELEEEVLLLRSGQMHARGLEEELAAVRAKLVHMRAMEEELMALRNASLRAKAMEEEIALLRTRLEAKAQVRSQTNVTETYKVKTFELAAKLAVMDGTDDGMYNGLPIEVEGEGLYRELVAQGRKPRLDTSLSGSKTSSITTSKETYKVKSFEMAEKLAKMDGTDDGLYNGLPIEVVGEGLYRDLVAAGRKSTVTTSTSGVRTSSVTTSTGTYKVSSYEMAEKLSKMDGTDDGLYNGLPIEVTGQGIFRELRAGRTGTSS